MRLRDTASRLPFPAEPPRHWPPPAFAFAERAVAARPVVAVGVTVMPAGAERNPARPHPSQHSPHLCLSLCRMGGIQDCCHWPPTCWDPRGDRLSTRGRR